MFFFHVKGKHYFKVPHPCSHDWPLTFQQKVFEQYKNVDDGPFYNFKYSDNFHWLYTYWSGLTSKIVTKSCEAISDDISPVRVTSSCAGAADAVNLISRQIGSVREHKELFMASFLVLPKTCLLHQKFQSQHKYEEPNTIILRDLYMVTMRKKSSTAIFFHNQLWYQWNWKQ